MPPFRISLLSLGKAGPSQLIEEAILADQLNFHRFWVTEHHSNLADSCLPVLIAAIAGKTQRVRVGSGGILLNLHNPLLIAEAFATLEELYPNRIDLGICRGGLDPETSAVLLDGKKITNPVEYYADRVRVLLAAANSGQLGGLAKGGVLPGAWVLGQGVNSMRLAASLGLAYSHSLFHAGAIDDPQVIREYHLLLKSHFPENPVHASIAVAGICAETDSAANLLLDQHTNDFIIPTVVGSQRSCLEQLTEIYEQYQIEEIHFLDLCQGMKDKTESMTLISELPLFNE
ncbi:LLM class flavin-dependent oxidoreductase [Massilia sp. MB5]|uniref:LLM class flavin-dependent oxidoreductase n=1 Tax=Massilia sp. MB5 TaxID=2919578 RepID=UPI001F0EA4D8|nr:LLM class flavin-dependent oxidoreductase [Massilia sp. MB5]UMR29234.1 LLM class flavin-dependent oxidoreductase [Massilia sp. MB5]